MRAVRRLQRLSVGLIAASLLAVGAAGLAVWGWKAAEAERNRAEQHVKLEATRAPEAEKARAEELDARRMAEGERQRAEQKARLATACELAAAAIDNLNRDRERGVLLAVQAVSETYAVDKAVTPEAEDALHRAVQAARVQLTLSGHSDMVTGAAFSPDGRHLATASTDGTVRVHALKIDDLTALSRRRVTRSLTSAECQRYLHQDQCPPTAMVLGAIVESSSRARVGDMAGAVASLRKAQELDPALALDPEAEGRALTVAGLVTKGKNRARAGDVDGAIESLQTARELNPTMVLDPQATVSRWAASALVERGIRLVEQGKAKEALASYEAAQEVDPRLRISADSWNLLCWCGSLRGYAADVMAACEQAVKLVPEGAYFRDSRGLARALTGAYGGAIEDFKFLVEWSRKSDLFNLLGSKRQAWIAELEKGRNPFDAATLEALQRSDAAPVTGSE